MNKLFKVIWSKSKQCYIVVSEVAKNTTGKKKIIVASVLAALTVSAQVATVEAAIQEGTTSGGASVALANSATASGSGAVAVGNNASASTTNALAVGTSTQSTGDGSVAVGSGSKATGTSAVAVGAGAYAKEHGAVALGNNVNVETNKAVGVGFAVTVRQAGATNIGYYSTVNTNQALSVGARNDVDGAAQYGTAVGYFVKVTGKNAVAIGSSNDNRGNSDSGRTLASADSAVAIGTSAHAEAAHSVGMGTYARASAENAISFGTSSAASGVQSIAIGGAMKGAEAPSASGTQSIAIGAKTSANSDSSIAMGSTATASGVATTAIGSEVLAKQHGSTAIGNQVKVEGNKSVGLGFQVSSKQDGTTAIGYITNVLGNQSVGIGSNMTVGENAGGAVAIGYMSSVTGQSGIGIGSNGTSASADSTIALGNTSKASGTSAIAIGKNSNAALAHSVALGEGSTTAEADGNATNGYLTNDAVNNTGNGVISVGNGGSILRRITSVASGTNDNDAINVKQLKALRNASISTVSVVNGATTTDLVPSTAVGDTDANKVKLVAGKNITLTAAGNSVTIAAKSEVNSITSGNTDAISVSTGTDGKVSVTPNLASNVNTAGDANKLVTAGKVKEALADKVSNDTLTTELAKKANAADVTNLTTNKLDKTAELHVKKGTYSVATDGSVTLDKADGTGATKSDEAVKITGLASKAKLDELKTTVDAKADKSYVDTELGKKVSTTDMNTALADKVSTAKLTEELNKKANASDITNLTSDKVSKADELHVKKGTFAVNTEGKVTLKKVNGAGAEANGEDVVIEGLASKSEITAINTELAKKVSNDTFTAEKNRVNGELANKLDTATFETAKATLATHDDINALKEVIANKLDKDTANAFVEGMKNKVSTDVLNKKLEDADKANADKLKAAKDELNTAITNATADKVSKADELHVVADSYEVDQVAGTVTLRQENGLNEPKADKNFTITGIATKQDVTNLTTKIGEKADKSYVDTELGKKANAADVATELGKKADQSALTALEGKVNAKADASALATMGENKLDKAAELHVKTGNPYTVDANGNVTLKQENGEGTEAAGKDIVIEGIASKANLDTLKGRVDTADGKIDTLTEKVAGHEEKLGKLDEKLTNVKALADENKGKVDGLTTRVDGIDGTLADHTAKLEEAKNGIDGINQNLTNNYATNDAVNKKLDNLKTELGTNTVLHFAGDKTIDENGTPDNPADDDNSATKLALNLKDQTLKVKGTTGEIETTAKGDTITLALSKAVKDDLAKVAQLGDTSADGRDGANGTAKDTGLTAKDGLNGKTLTEKVNAIRNGEAGSVVYTDDQGNRLTKANDGKYYLADDVGEDGNKKGSAQPVETDKLQVNAVNPLDPTKGVKMSNLVDGKIAANSKDAVTGNQVYNTTNSIATALGGGASVNTDGTLSEPTYNLKDKNGNAVTKHNVGDALATINDRFDSISSATNVEVDKLKDMENLTDTGKKNIKSLVGEAINIKGDGKIIATAHTDESGNKIFSLQLSRDMATADQVNEVRQKAEQNSKRISEVGAHSAALAALNPLSYDPLRKSQIMAGVGTYAGNQALALGLAHYANENFMVTAGLTMGAGKSMANLGATYRFGTGEDDAIPERYKGGPISSVYVMQDEITALKAENARKDAENAEMKAQIKMLMERMGLA
ncbi:YadA-like family protein [Veillonella sp. VA142]|uniref:YadA-like family protein n=1 Tax=Veillonella sp. VA142 TaxID=741834 RepID=UPI0013DFC497|nr:YadA-like family protein [Veillonella sp. VA142]